MRLFFHKAAAMLKHHQSRSFLTQWERENLRSSVDWREKGVLSPIRNQGSCASCWAFAAIEAVEALHKIETGSSVRLSAQELLDCCYNLGDRDGGWTTLAYEYMITNGIGFEADYGYIGRCRLGRATPLLPRRFWIANYSHVAPDERSLMAAVGKRPISVDVCAGVEFYSYSGGIFRVRGPCTKAILHAVLLVGYGTTRDGKNYWIVKNSWGIWGPYGGYMYIARDIGLPRGQCDIALYATYPIIRNP